MTLKNNVKAKVGDKIRIVGFVADYDGNIPEYERSLIGKTGTVKFVDGIGALHGTWGNISLLPEDRYVVISA